ncbi:hypothetical protein TPHA_0M01900 [Tetrapisispora phaffii CBS 4417]|uniref:mRNA decay factor PAT1 domain-containing protein n=1 Tax=Tetrapisispora phaffii (strain ATCC 24235 / CBS 4417 / NBRC 1672 / NRRL Y-8282 / UCD 70-5) TaxID=1071381 RepID=G8C0Q0_TETPH|nr:hypothetical protein TPHA_0M01900 [Tetrapisispora phaffii CBS 4417]CCE65765.1 hypothetical protein TPHA_0M01900 [Tetrapisispora phaffii CBS 4417]
MSFFGFNSKLPNEGNRQRHDHGKKDNNNSPLDFEDTYKGYGEYEREEDDYLNDETFGDDVAFGTDFDFGHGSSSANSGMISTNQSQGQQGFNDPVGMQGAQAQQQQFQMHSSYAAAASTTVPQQQAQMNVTMDMRPMESLWSNQPDMSTQVGQNEVLSMEELERQQIQMQQQQQHPPPQMFMPNYPNQQPQQPQQQFQNNYQNNFQNNFQNPQNMNNQFQQPPPPQIFNQPPPPNQQQTQAQMNQAPVHMDSPGQFNPQHMHAMHAVPGGMPMPMQMNNQISNHLHHQQFDPSLELKNQNQHRQQQVMGQNIGQNELLENDQALSTPSPKPTHQVLQREDGSIASNGNNNQSYIHIKDKGPRRMSRRSEPLSSEEQKRLQIRHAKVEKILKNAGLMTPRDKDFITRYQLSQIVTEDPYNEDFYFQVYKIIQTGGVAGKSNKDLIARAYLEHSGHRLGGRYKRADVALQRMQNQVEKAVTVAKERPQKNKDNTDSAREGVLGKISSSLNSKAPRRQLQIPSPKLSDEEDESKLSSHASSESLEEVTESLNNVGINQSSRSRRRSSYAFSSVDQISVLSRSGGRKFVLSLIETVYEEVLELEAQLRSGNETDSTGLWESLHIGDEAYDVSPFISMLSFDKGVKIMPRIFNFLDKASKLKLLQTFFNELSHLNVIIISSFKTNPTPTEAQLKKIELFQGVFLKIIVSFLSSSADFIEIMGLLLHLIRNNNVSFISTSTLGLNLITILISRAAIIKQDCNRTNSLSSPDIQAWNEIYDKLFISLETKLSLVFPPQEYRDTVVKETSQSGQLQQSNTQYFDQSYIWQFLASLALSGKLNHQRIIIDEVRDEIFGTINCAEQMKSLPDQSSAYRRDKLYQDLNLFLNVMGLVARDGEISELK